MSMDPDFVAALEALLASMGPPPANMTPLEGVRAGFNAAGVTTQTAFRKVLPLGGFLMFTFTLLSD